MCYTGMTYITKLANHFISKYSAEFPNMGAPLEKEAAEQVDMLKKDLNAYNKYIVGGPHSWDDKLGLAIPNIKEYLSEDNREELILKIRHLLQRLVLSAETRRHWPDATEGMRNLMKKMVLTLKQIDSKIGSFLMEAWRLDKEDKDHIAKKEDRKEELRKMLSDRGFK